VFGCPADPAIIDQYADAGFTRCVIWLPSAGTDEVRRALDASSEVIDRYVAA
jgi:hypothetical protein